MAGKVKMPAMWRSVQDTSAFVRDPCAFLSAQRESKGEVFGARVLHFAVVFAASHAAVEEVLAAASMSSKKGYAAFQGLQLFGPTVLFEDGERHAGLREALRGSEFACPRRLQASGMREAVRSLADERFAALRARGEGCQVRAEMYPVIKVLCAELLHQLFLERHGLQVELEDFKRAQARLWRGTVSTGLNVSVNLGFGVRKKTAFAEAQAAREELVKLFGAADDAAGRPAAEGEGGSGGDAAPRCPFQRRIEAREDRLNHYVMFTSSMVSKSVGSIVTSFVKAMHDHPTVRARLVRELSEGAAAAATGERDTLDCVLLEVERLFPPVLGCCRTTTAAVTIRGRDIPKGTRVWCSFITANRDPAVFPDPLRFDPERWRSSVASAAAAAHMSYGAAQHECLGKPFSRMVLREICASLVQTFPSWRVEGESAFRWLPVARPVDGLSTTLFYSPVPEASSSEAGPSVKDDNQQQQQQQQQQQPVQPQSAQVDNDDDKPIAPASSEQQQQLQQQQQQQQQQAQPDNTAKDDVNNDKPVASGEQQSAHDSAQESKSSLGAGDVSANDGSGASAPAAPTTAEVSSSPKVDKC